MILPAQPIVENCHLTRTPTVRKVPEIWGKKFMQPQVRGSGAEVESTKQSSKKFQGATKQKKKKKKGLVRTPKRQVCLRVAKPNDLGADECPKLQRFE